MDLKQILDMTLTHNVSAENDIPDFLISYENYLKTSTAEINFAIVSIENAINNIATEGIKETLTKVKYGIIKLLDMIIHAIDRFISMVKDMFFNAEKQIEAMKKRIRPDIEYFFGVVAERMEKKCQHILLFGNDYIKNAELLISTWPKQLINNINNCNTYLKEISKGNLNYKLDLVTDIKEFLYFTENNGIPSTGYFEYDINNPQDLSIKPSTLYANQTVDKRKKVTGATMIAILNKLSEFIKVTKDVTSKVYETKKLCREISKQVELNKDASGITFEKHIKNIKLAGITIPQNMLKTHAIIIKELLICFKMLADTLPSEPSIFLEMMMLKSDIISKGKKRISMLKYLKDIINNDWITAEEYADSIYDQYITMTTEYCTKVMYYGVECYSVNIDKIDKIMARYGKNIYNKEFFTASCAITGHIFFNLELFKEMVNNYSIKFSDNLCEFAVLHELGHRMDLCHGKVASSGKDILNTIKAGNINSNPETYSEAIADAYAIKQMRLTFMDYVKNYRIIHPKGIHPDYDFDSHEAYYLSKKI